MDIESFREPQKRLGIVFLGLVILIPLILGVIVWYTAIQRNKAILELAPEDVIQTFREAGFTIEGLQDITYYPMPVHPGVYGQEFNMVTGGDVYQILVILYSDQVEAKKTAKEVNGLNRSMNGGHASAFSYGAILVQVYPSDETLTNRLQRILNEMD